MSAIIPPLDTIPKLPGKAVTLLLTQIDTQTDELLSQISEVIQDTVQLPTNAKCNDPRIAQIKTKLTEVLTQLESVKDTIPKIQQTIDGVKTAITIAQSIKATITAAQLSNPVTAPLFIAQQAMAIQDATIVNALESVNQLSTVPATLTSKLTTIIPPLIAAITKIATACNDNEFSDIQLPTELIQDYNAMLPTQFYTELNVSDSDIQQRAVTIEDLVTQQRNLLTSLQEAPSKVYQQDGPPAANLGKPGDYYVDTATQTVYGPKPTQNSWT